jgi:hypothetical protein
VRTAAEAVVVVTGPSRSLIGLRRRLGGAELRHEEIGRGPRKQQANEQLDDGVSAQCPHAASLTHISPGIGRRACA